MLGAVPWPVVKGFAGARSCAPFLCWWASASHQGKPGGCGDCRHAAAALCAGLLVLEQDVDARAGGGACQGERRWRGSAWDEQRRRGARRRRVGGAGGAPARRQCPGVHHRRRLPVIRQVDVPVRVLVLHCRPESECRSLTRCTSVAGTCCLARGRPTRSLCWYHPSTCSWAEVCRASMLACVAGLTAVPALWQLVATCMCLCQAWACSLAHPK